MKRTRKILTDGVLPVLCLGLVAGIVWKMLPMRPDTAVAKPAAETAPSWPEEEVQGRILFGKIDRFSIKEMPSFEAWGKWIASQCNVAELDDNVREVPSMWVRFVNPDTGENFFYSAESYRDFKEEKRPLVFGLLSFAPDGAYWQPVENLPDAPLPFEPEKGGVLIPWEHFPAWIEQTLLPDEEYRHVVYFVSPGVSFEQYWAQFKTLFDLYPTVRRHLHILLQTQDKPWLILPQS